MAKWHGGDAPAGTIPQNYQRYFVPAIGAPAAHNLIVKADLRPGERVLDVACGTGVATRMAAERVGTDGSVAGLDINPGMLAVAEATTPGGMAIDWHEASAEEMPLEGGSFDVVLCQMGLQFMPDKPQVLREMHRVLSDDGRVLLNLPGPTPELFVILAEALGRHAGPEAAGFARQVFALHNVGEIRGLLSDAGFRDVTVDAELQRLVLPAPADFLWQYVNSTPLAAAVAKLDDDRREQLEAEVVGAWRRFVGDGGLRLDVRMVTASGRK